MVEKYSTNDWRKDMLNDNNFEQKTTFNYDLCVTLLEECCKDLDNLNPFLLLRPIWEITKGFRAISSALSVGFSDITSKVQVWRDILKTHYTEETSIQQVIEKEISLGIHECNGDNNSDKGHKKKTKYYEYCSGTRTLLRLTWFLDFFNNILKHTMESPEKSFTDCIRAAYDTALGPHHPWLVRKASSVGIAFAPSKREKGMSFFFGKEAFDDDIKAKVTRWRESTTKLWQYIHKYYEDKKLLELP
jgi:hypothetical protein